VPANGHSGGVLEKGACDELLFLIFPSIFATTTPHIFNDQIAKQIAQTFNEATSICTGIARTFRNTYNFKNNPPSALCDDYRKTRAKEAQRRVESE
jgi:hypothetical protein